MIFVIITFSLLSGYTFLATKNKWHNPVTVFCFMWAGISFLYSLRLIDYYDISVTTEFALLFQMVGFVVGGIAAQRASFSVRATSKASSYSYKLNYKLMYVLCIITIFVLYQDAIVVIRNLLSGVSLYDMTSEGMIEENSTTGIMVVIKIFIVFPVVYGISAVTASELFLNTEEKHPKKLLVFFNIIITLLYSLQHGGRHCLIIFAVSYLFAYSMRSKVKKLSRNVKRMVWILLGATVLFMVFLSNSRGISNDSLLMSLYKYFSGCIPNLSVWINTVEKDITHTYGLTALNGFISPFMILLTGVGIISRSPEICRIAQRYVLMPEAVTRIGNGIGFNAFVSPGYAFYIDGGLLGVLIGSFLYGFVAMNLYNNFKRKGFMTCASSYIVIAVTIIMSFTKFQFSQYFYAMAFVMCFLVYKKEIKR